MENSQISWEGDWLLRRKRLHFIDKQITKAIPNILLLQEMMSKNGNPYDNDAAILERSSLAYYDDFVTEHRLHENTEEMEMMGTYVRLDSASTEEILLLKKQTWNLGKEGSMVFQKLSLEGSPLYLFNINMPKGKLDTGEWVKVLHDNITDALESENSCRNQIILAGFFGELASKLQFAKLMDKFDLIDTGVPFCSAVGKKCYTESPTNPILNSSSLPNQFRRSERIYVHKSTLVSEGRLVYTKSFDSLPSFKLKYKLFTLPSSLYYGWETKVKFSSCMTI